MLRNICRINVKPILFSDFPKTVSNLILNGFCSEQSMSEPAAKKVRYNGRSKKRQWQERCSKQPEETEENPSNENGLADQKDPDFVRIKRHKFVLLLGYSGIDYYGMQRNPQTKTIEEDLFKALLATNLINEECFNQVQNMQFQRAARTDKGVSASRQIVSMKLGENVDVDLINQHLPEVIRVFAHKRVTKGFNSKSQCDSRTYIYLMPTIAFASPDQEVSQKTFRTTEETINIVNDILQCYVGTKNYHNFTSKKKPNDPSAKRYIKIFTCEKPFVRKDTEFAVIKVQGQSFMLHQIRKMIGLMLAIVRGRANKDTLEKAFTDEKINIPRAPGLGLVLDYVHYDNYNFRYGQDGIHEQLTWEHVEHKVVEFRDKFIFPTIINAEIEEEQMIYWLNNKLERHNYIGQDEDDDDEDDSINVGKKVNEKKSEETTVVEEKVAMS